MLWSTWMPLSSVSLSHAAPPPPPSGSADSSRLISGAALSSSSVWVFIQVCQPQTWGRAFSCSSSLIPLSWPQPVHLFLSPHCHPA